MQNNKTNTQKHPFLSGRWSNLINNDLILKNWFINNTSNNDTKCFGYMPNREVRSLFLGSFPINDIVDGPISEKNLEFFYGSIKNDFWPCLGSIFGRSVINLEDRIQLLHEYNIGITDILSETTRNEKSSNLDKDIASVSYNNLLSLKNTYPNLKNIFITSGGKSPIPKLNSKNGNVGTWFRDSISKYNPKGFNKYGFVKEITVADFDFNLIYLFSPSNSANLARKRELNQNKNFGFDNLLINDYRKMQWSYFINEYHLKESKSIINNNVSNQAFDSLDLLRFFEI